MAIQVILREQADLLKEVSCKNCSALLRYAPVDTKESRTVDYTGGVDIYTYLVCPVCSSKVILK